MLCGVTATLGSNPSATATAARPRWGRAVLLYPSGVCPWAALSCPSALLFEVPQWFPSNVARNSPATASSIESWSLELQRLWPISKNDRVKLRAKCGWGGFLGDACRRRSQALRTVGRAPIGGFFRLKYRGGSPTMSHAIPLPIFQVLKSNR